MFNRTLASWGLVVSMAITSSCVQQDGLGPIAASNEGPVTNIINDEAPGVAPNPTPIQVSGETKIVTPLGDQIDYIAILKEGSDLAAAERLAQLYGIEIKQYIDRFRAMSFSASSALAQQIVLDPAVAGVQKDPEIKLSLNTAVKQIKADKVKAEGVDGTGARVCIIDSGMNYHADLALPEKEYDFVDDDGRAEDINGHGTPVAGIIASQDQGGLINSGYTGVAPGSTLLIAKVFGAEGTTSGSLIASALDWCADQGAEVINMSLGHGGYKDYCDTDYTALFSNTIAEMGITVIAASGNDGFTDKVSSPACGSKTISVGSVSKSDQRSYFSNGGKVLDIVAPGERIVTTDKDGGYSNFSGTSAATPFVAGAASLLKSSGNFTSNEIKAALKNGAQDMGDAGKDFDYGNGRLDAFASYEMLQGGETGGGETGGGETGGGETGGGETGGGEQTGPIVFSTGQSFLGGEAFSRKYSGSQTSVSKSCPAGHYLEDMEIQKTWWWWYRSVTWANLKCRSISKLNDSIEVGKKRHSGDRRVKGDLCGAGEAITGMNVVTRGFVKDFRFECGKLNYDKNAEGQVEVHSHSLSRSYLFGHKRRSDDETKVSCPSNTVAVGITASGKTDRNEWGFTKIGLKCASLETVESSESSSSSIGSSSIERTTPTRSGPSRRTVRRGGRSNRDGSVSRVEGASRRGRR